MGRDISTSPFLLSAETNCILNFGLESYAEDHKQMKNTASPAALCLEYAHVNRGCRMRKTEGAERCSSLREGPSLEDV